MGTSRNQISQLLTECRWSEDGSYLKDILKNHMLPVIAKVSQGQYASIGQPTFATSGLVSHALIISAGSQQRSIVAQCVKFKTGRRRILHPFGPTLLIPNSYSGHFEILNEEGRNAGQDILTVEGLTKTLPKTCLVRESFKVFLAEVAEGSPDNKVYRIASKTRSLLPGELLTLGAEVTVPSGKGKVAKYLRCQDQDFRTIFLPCVPKGKFSPVSSDDDSIGGVHTTRGIMRKRLPLMVRLVEGRPPSGRNLKFFPELRLYTTIQDELIFALPLVPSWKESLIPLPASAPLKFQVAKNMDELEAGFKQFESLVLKANSLLLTVKDHIQLYDINLQKELRFDGQQWKPYAPPIFLPSSDVAKEKADHISDEDDYEEIDKLYDYVRGMKKPSSNSTQPQQQYHQEQRTESKSSTTLVTITSCGPDVIAHISNKDENNRNRNVTSNKPHIMESKQRHSLCELALKESLERLTPPQCPPPPPPIETIPTRKFLNSSSPPPDLSISVQNAWGNKSSPQGTQIQIQIRRGENTKDVRGGDIVITTVKDKLDSVGNSLSTTPTNTTGSAQSSSSSSNKGQSRTRLYVKHGEGSDGSNGSVANRPFRRSQLFDYRYKSLTDLSNGMDYTNFIHGKSSNSQGHGHNHVMAISGSWSNLHMPMPMVQHPMNKPQNFLNPLHRNGGQIMYRPKSLTNLAIVEEGVAIRSSNPKLAKGFNYISNSNKNPCCGVKKKILTEVIMPSTHIHHNGHIMNIPLKSSSQRSGKHYRKSSLQHSALFL